MKISPDRQTVHASSADVYYKSGYWNDFDAVRAEINRRISGRGDMDYVAQFRRVTQRRRFARGLFLNCGNGWVEREFLALGVVDSAVGIDYSEELLERARASAAAEKLPVRYARMDINEGALPDERFDLIVNFAAGHHIARLDRVLRELCRRATPDAWFLNNDYIGPHRNQYAYEHWAAVWDLNRSLPADAQQALNYPHLPTMLHTDPSEAVHSELIVETFARYFTIDGFSRIGGALAYPLLTFNENLAQLPARTRETMIARILDADRGYLASHPQHSLFAFWTGRPRHDVLADDVLLARWSADEEARESRARDSGGWYYPVTLLQSLYYPEMAGLNP